MPHIIGETIMLREYRKEDLPHIRAWVNDSEIVEFLSDIFLYPHTLNETERFLNHVLDATASDEKHFVIAEKNTGDYIGQIDLMKINWTNRVAEIGIVIGKKDAHGKGIGTEAMKLLQSFAFERMNLNRLELVVHDYNPRAYRCYTKCGFVEEGRWRKKQYHKGEYHDLILMGIVKEEYEKIKGGS